MVINFLKEFFIIVGLSTVTIGISIGFFWLMNNLPLEWIVLITVVVISAFGTLDNLEEEE